MGKSASSPHSRELMRHHSGVDERAADIEALASSIRDRVEAFNRGLRKRAPRSKLGTLASIAGYRRLTPAFRTRLAATLRDVGVVAQPGIESPDVHGDTWLTSLLPKTRVSRCASPTRRASKCS